MNLTPTETERFYRIWWPLLHYTNWQRHLVPDLPVQGPITSPEALKIRQALWADDALRESFIADNPVQLSSADLAVVASWRYRRAGRFFVLRYLKKYTIFLDDGSPPHAYGVLGLTDPFQVLIGPYLPVLVQAVLLPFEDKIIYDGLLSYYNITFGRGIRENLNTTFRDAQEREGIITSLLPVVGPPTGDEMRQTYQARNDKILSAFRKELYKSGLSPKMVEQHTCNVETFSNVYLMEQDPPRLLLDIEAKDLENYFTSGIVRTEEEKSIVTSFKRFLRFLWESGRLNPTTFWSLQDVLKRYRQRAR